MSPPTLFGASLDPDDGAHRVALKVEYARLDATETAHGAARDPYDVLVPYLAGRGGGAYRDAGKVPTPSWLTPFPAASDLPRLRPEAFAAFVQEGGCAEYARRVEEFLKRLAPAGPVAMLGVDHSATGGAFAALSAAHGPEDLALIVVDAHLDAVSEPARSGLLAFAREHPDPDYRLDPAAYVSLGGARASYNCGSFLRSLVEWGALRPANLLVLGVADAPAPRLARSNDPRVSAFLEEYGWLAARGATVVGRAALADPRRAAASAAAAVARLPARHAYLSWDLDVGAAAAVLGVRFAELPGLDEKCLAGLARGILEGLAARRRLVALDVMEFDFYAAGAEVSGHKDRTYDIALALLTQFRPALAAA